MKGGETVGCIMTMGCVVRLPCSDRGGRWWQLLALRMYPGCEKVDPEVTAKTTLECISDLIQSERDISLFTKFLYSRYSIKDS